MSLVGIQAGDRFRILGLSGQPDPGAWITVDSSTNNGALNCTLNFDDDPGRSALTTVGVADFDACLEAGIYMIEARYNAAKGI